jgi:hypothetical protein
MNPYALVGLHAGKTEPLAKPFAISGITETSPEICEQSEGRRCIYKCVVNQAQHSGGRLQGARRDA